MSVKIDELFDAALAGATEENFKKLYDALKTQESPADQRELLGMLFESWPDDEDEPITDAQANFTVSTLELKCGDSAVFRKAMNRAVRRLLPPYLNKPGLVRTLGINDANVSLHESARRFRNLLNINANTLVFLRSAKRWGAVRNVDALAGTVAFVPVGSSASSSLSVATLLGDGVLFMLAPDSQKLADPVRRRPRSGAEFRSIAASRAFAALDDDLMREIAQATLVPAAFSEEEFEKWWQSAGAAAAGANCAVGGTRGSWNSRSLQEMRTLLANEDVKCAAIPEHIAGYHEFFVRLRTASIIQEAKDFAAAIAELWDRVPHDKLGDVLMPLAQKCPFLPVNPAEAKLDDLCLYGELNVKTLSKMFSAFRLFTGDEYLAALGVRLPLKAVTVLAEVIDRKALFAAMRSCPANADVFMFIWRNRAKTTQELLGLISIVNVVKVLNQSRLPKEWMVAVRELKNTLMDKADFQEYLLDAAGRDSRKITEGVKGALVLNSGELQSLMVKFARLDKNLQEHLASGVGSRMMQEAADADKDAKPKDQEPMYSSVASVRRLKDELDNIINVEQPKNREALKTARAHGDFRENSEFDAAKERRNFLTRRRNELEHILMQVQTINLAGVVIDDHAPIGCTVTLEYPNGTIDVHHLLGAWDGDPDKHYLSYKTRLGEAIYRHKIGATLDLPDGSRAVLRKIEPLTPEIIAELDA